MRQRTQPALQPGIDPLLHHRLRNRELELVDQLLDQLVLGLRLQPLPLAPRHVLPELLLKLLPRLRSAKLLRQLRVTLGETLPLDRLHLHVVVHCLTGQPAIAKVSRILNLDRELVSRLLAAKSIGERCNRVLAANLDQHILARNRLGLLGGHALLGHGLRQRLDLAGVLNVGPVALRQGAVFLDRLYRSVALEHTIQFALELLVRQVNLRLLHTYRVIPGDIYLRQHLECRLEAQGRAIRKLQIQ